MVDGETVYGCFCDPAKGYISNAEGVCQCDANRKLVSDVNGECECADGYELYNDVCVVICQPNQVRSADGICECDANRKFVSDGSGECECADGYELYNDVCVAICQTNQVRSETGICECGTGFTQDNHNRCCVDPIGVILSAQDNRGTIKKGGWSTYNGKGYMHLKFVDGTVASASGSWYTDYHTYSNSACVVGAWWGSATGEFALGPWSSSHISQVVNFGSDFGSDDAVKRANCCGRPGTGDVIYSNCDDPRELFQKRVVDGDTVYGCFNTCRACVDACSTPEHAKTLKTRHAELTACHTDLEVTGAAEACTISCMREKCQDIHKDLIAEKYKELVVKKVCE